MNAKRAGLAGTILIVALPCAMAANTAAPPAKVPTEAAPPPCEACHGAHGEGVAAAHVPRLTGQSAEYLKKQLDDYADGTRDNPIMKNFAKALSEKQRTEFATRYASMSAPFPAPGSTVKAAQLARGHQLAFQGDEQRRVQACNSCHGPDGVGVLHAAPYLAGQSAEYLASALKAFQQGTRKNDAGEMMRSVVKQLNADDVAAVSGYYANMSFTTK
jgi:cytochrome c553